MRKLVIYVHGKGGNAAEAEHYVPLFNDADVVGFDYVSSTPWQAKTEFSDYFDNAVVGYDEVYVVANSIGAFFTMTALGGKKIKRAYFISPIVNMERLISDIIKWANVTEAQLEEQKEIPTSFGETLSWEYLSYVRTHPIVWTVPTAVLYGENDNLTPLFEIKNFAKAASASLTVVPGGEHWFHTAEQLAALDRWIEEKSAKF